MHKITIVLVLVFLVLMPYLSYSQNNPEGRQVIRIEGEVTALDWVKSAIIVRTTSADYRDEITILVPQGTTILRGTEGIVLADVHVGDRVIVEYYNASPGPLKAISITDMSLAEVMN